LIREKQHTGEAQKYNVIQFKPPQASRQQSFTDIKNKARLDNITNQL